MDFDLQTFDELVGFGGGEFAAGLPLGESHRAAGVSVAGVPGGFEEFEELTELPR